MTYQDETHRDETPVEDTSTDESSDTSRHDTRPPGKAEDDSPVERYRDSPGLAATKPMGEVRDVPEPNEPG